MRSPATYKEIQKWVQQQFGFTPETCWITHCKELYNLPLSEAPNRQGGERVKPCPPEKRTAIKKTFEHFGLARRSAIGVYPIGGWWKENPAHGRYDRVVRYALIVSIRAVNGTVDIYTPVVTQIATPIEIAT